MTPEKKFDLLSGCLKFNAIANSSIFNPLRILKGINKGDLYYDAYFGHYNKRGDTFVDYYHLLWTIGAIIQPKNVMEIGCRTGISICQLLSSCVKSFPEKIVLFDLFGDDFLSEELIRLNMRHLNLPADKVEFVIGDSKQTVPIYRENGIKFDFILVDGCHEEETAKLDLDNVTSLISVGGIIIFDDIAPDGCNLINVWNKWKFEQGDKFFYCENFDGKGFGLAVLKE